MRQLGGGWLPLGAGAGEGMSTFQEGGLVGEPKGRVAGFTPKGTDTVPVMATPGELMLPVSLVQWFKHALTGSSSVQQATQYKGAGGTIARGVERLRTVLLPVKETIRTILVPRPAAGDGAPESLAVQYKAGGGLIQAVTENIRTVAQTFTSRASVLRERATETLVQYRQAGGVIATLAQRAAPLVAMPVPIYLQAGGLIGQLEAGGTDGNGGAVLRVIHESGAAAAPPAVGAAQVGPSPMSARPIQINVSAIDAAGVYQFFEKNKRAIASMVLDAESGNHPSRRAFGGRR
jgi:hypothetical protein